MTREQQIIAVETHGSPLPYEAPRLSVLGTVQELTKKITGHADGGASMS
jgi:hypothetical protein